MVKLFKVHKIPLERRVVNVFFQRHKPGTSHFLYTVHWPADILIRAMTSSPQKAEEIIRQGYKLQDGGPPDEWFMPHLMKR